MRDCREVRGRTGGCESERVDVGCREMGVDFRSGMGMGTGAGCLGIAVE